MKTFSINNKDFPTPRRMALYLMSVVAFCFFNWAVLYAEGNNMNEAASLESRLAEALKPTLDPQYEIEDWLVNFSDVYMVEESRSANSLQTRLSQALEPVAEEEPALEEWLLTFSDNMPGSNMEEISKLESRLADALEPIADPEPELEDWMFRISDVLLQSDC